MGNSYGNTLFFRNTGSVTAPAFAAPISNPFGLTDVGLFAAPTFADIDGDGALDAFVGNFDGNTLFFLNASPPNLEIAATDADKAEGNAGFTAFTFTVTRTGNTAGASSANWVVSGSGANPADANDFGGALPSGAVNFAAGETTQTITVNVSGDLAFEPDEGFTVTLSSPVNAGITTGAAAGTIQNDDSSVNIITGTAGNNFLSGTDGEDLIDGKGGNDTILGRDGDDYLIGGAGADTIQGNNGNDIIFGGPGRDRLSGDNGNDQLFGGEDNDTLLGGNGADLLVGGKGADTLIGGAGADKFDYQDLTDSLLSGFGGFDVITDFRANADQFLVSNLPTLFTPSAGKVAFLSESRIQAILTPSVLANPGDAAVFTNGSNDRTFLSLNGATPGFQANEDALIELRNFALVGTLTAANFTLS